MSSGSVTSRLAEILRTIADRLSPVPFFGDLDDEAGPREWAGLVVLHAEMVHGCNHTTEAREAIGMIEPAA